MARYYERLEQLREDHDLSQQKLCIILEMPQSQYSRYETGKRDIPIEVLRKLCMIYQVSADYILELPKGLGWPR